MGFSCLASLRRPREGLYIAPEGSLEATWLQDASIFVQNALRKKRVFQSGKIETFIGRSDKNRKKMAVVENGKMAITKWKVLDIFTPFASLIECKLETGRTHQIRVHMSYLGHGIIGDDLYGRPITQKNFKNSYLKEKNKLIKSFSRQALHATKLCLNHPINNKYLEFSSPLPKDISVLIEDLKV